MYRISEGKNFKTISFFKKTQACIGYSSKTEDNKHILLLDYDHVEKNVVYEDVSAIQLYFSLPPAYLFTTKEKKEDGNIVGNYHVVFLCKNNSRKTFEIMGEVGIDSNFRDSPLRKESKSWVLRIGKKNGSGEPKFLEMIGNKNLNYPISTAHKKLLKKFFPKIKHPKYKNEDGLSQIKIQMYETKG